jgi:prepilin-type N-terminal cleavage/methylation domain-containing protein
MSKSRARGFTLIELLTVIAIIAILVGLTATVLPQVLEKAKVTNTENDFSQIRTALVQYQTENNGLPPGYGYRRFTPVEIMDIFEGTPPADEIMFNLRPYMTLIGHFRNFDLYDEDWSDSYDTSGNNHVDMLEFNPLGTQLPNGKYSFSNTLYDGSNVPNAPYLREAPPFAYFAVNKAQAEKYRLYCETRNDPYGNTWDDTDPRLQSITFPPPFYDAFVLISAGPGGGTFGVIPEDDDFLTPAGRDLEDRYNLNALRAYYRATRDLNKNGVLDFDFRARTRENETEYLLPDGSNEEGPMIFVSN